MGPFPLSPSLAIIFNLPMMFRCKYYPVNVSAKAIRLFLKSQLALREVFHTSVTTSAFAKAYDLSVDP